MRQVVNNPVCIGQVYVAGGRVQLIQHYHVKGEMTSQSFSTTLVPFFLSFLADVGWTSVKKHHSAVLSVDNTVQWAILLSDTWFFSLFRCSLISMIFQMKKHCPCPSVKWVSRAWTWSLSVANIDRKKATKKIRGMQMLTSLVNLQR